MQPGDWPAVRRIYQEGIDGGHATFESTAPDWEAFNTTRLPGHRHVAGLPGRAALGWAAVTPVSSRTAYAGVVEHSIYVSTDAHGQGIGAALLQGTDRLHRERRDLDYSIQRLPRKRTQPQTPPGPRLHSSRTPQSHRPHAARSTRRAMARHTPHRTAFRTDLMAS
jgi:GNAT superfamily N-acetyltransferase